MLTVLDRLEEIELRRLDTEADTGSDWREQRRLKLIREFALWILGMREGVALLTGELYSDIVSSSETVSLSA